MNFAIALQLISVVTSFISVYYWWRSATFKSVSTSTTAALAQVKAGDMVFEYETDKSIFIRYSEQSKLNANAAAWTGVDVSAGARNNHRTFLRQVTSCFSCLHLLMPAALPIWLLPRERI